LEGYFILGRCRSLPFFPRFPFI